jgi:hypothetical protein
MQMAEGWHSAAATAVEAVKGVAEAVKVAAVTAATEAETVSVAVVMENTRCRSLDTALDSYTP